MIFPSTTAAKLDWTHIGGDVFEVTSEPSDECVLWGELISEKERRFLQQHMKSRILPIYGNNCCRLHLRVCLQEDRQKRPKSSGIRASSEGATPDVKPSRVAVFL